MRDGKYEEAIHIIEHQLFIIINSRYLRDQLPVIKQSNKYMIRISLLCHPVDLLFPLVRVLIQKLNGQSTKQTIEDLSLAVSTIEISVANRIVKVILVQPLGSGFYNKMFGHHFRSSGAIIAFLKDSNDSFEASRALYQRFKDINTIDVPIAFIGILRSPDDPIVNEPLQLEVGSSEFYYFIPNDDFKEFARILHSLVTRILSPL